jgi:hypothetical protein
MVKAAALCPILRWEKMAVGKGINEILIKEIFL